MRSPLAGCIKSKRACVQKHAIKHARTERASLALAKALLRQIPIFFGSPTIGLPAAGQMNTDLMRAAGFDGHVQQAHCAGTWRTT
jgi:hypothetical protein